MHPSKILVSLQAAKYKLQYLKTGDLHLCYASFQKFSISKLANDSCKSVTQIAEIRPYHHACSLSKNLLSSMKVETGNPEDDSCKTLLRQDVHCRGRTVMMDCGVHPGYSGLRSLPYLDNVDLSTVDLMLITHFHLDHCAAVPYVTSHTNFKVGDLQCFFAAPHSSVKCCKLQCF